MNTHFLAFEQEAPTQPLQRLLDLNVYLNDNFCPSFFSSNSKTKIDAELMMKWAFPIRASSEISARFLRHCFAAASALAPRA